MKINKDTKIIGEKVILVPYLPHHVEKYHKWMKDEELLELTASDPLSLKEEYEMQQSWQNDEDKCTFIILDRNLYNETNQEISSMIGDTNVFLSNGDDSKLGEAEIMIAEKNFRRGGRGKEAMLLMLRYCIENLKLEVFDAKIGFSNKPSLNMFQKFQFIEVSKSEVFKECTLEVRVDQDWITWLKNETICYSLKNYLSNSVS